MPASVKFSVLGLPTPSTGGGGSWGSILGNIADQTDLQTALGLLAPKANPTFSGTVIIGTGGIQVPSGIPGVTTNKIYQSGGSLYFNGSVLAGGGGGTTLHTGTAVVDFGTGQGSDYAQITVTGQTGILSTSTVRAFMMRDTTAEHSADEHLMVPMKLVCGNIVDNTSFTLHAISEWHLTGTFVVHYIWSN